MTSGAALRPSLAASLKKLKKNPLNVDVVMVKVVDVNAGKKKGRKKKAGAKRRQLAPPPKAPAPETVNKNEEEEEGYGDDFDQQSQIDANPGDDDYGDDFDRPSRDDYGDDFDEEAPSPLKPTPKKKENASGITPTRERSRTFAFGLDPISKQPSIDHAALQRAAPPGMPIIPALTVSTPTINVLREKVSHSKSLASLTAGEQYRHRRMIEQSARSFHTVKTLRDTLRRDEVREQQRMKRAYDKWIKENPPKSGVENR